MYVNVTGQEIAWVKYVLLLASLAIQWAREITVASVVLKRDWTGS